jgi:hypothetical protein
MRRFLPLFAFGYFAMHGFYPMARDQSTASLEFPMRDNDEILALLRGIDAKLDRLHLEMREILDRFAPSAMVRQHQRDEVWNRLVKHLDDAVKNIEEAAQKPAHGSAEESKDDN